MIFCLLRSLYRPRDVFALRSLPCALSLSTLLCLSSPSPPSDRLTSPSTSLPRIPPPVLPLFLFRSPNSLMNIQIRQTAQDGTDPAAADWTWPPAPPVPVSAAAGQAATPHSAGATAGAAVAVAAEATPAMQRLPVRRKSRGEGGWGVTGTEDASSLVFERG